MTLQDVADFVLAIVTFSNSGLFGLLMWLTMSPLVFRSP